MKSEVGVEGDEGVGALIHTCLPKDAPSLTRHGEGELACQSCGKLNWPWQVQSLSVCANTCMNDFSAMLFERKHQLCFLGQGSLFACDLFLFIFLIRSVGWDLHTGEGLVISNAWLPSVNFSESTKDINLFWFYWKGFFSCQGFSTNSKNMIGEN